MTYNIFISHAWSYTPNYDTLYQWLIKGFNNTVDCSIPKNDPVHYAQNNTQLANAIAQRIANSHILIAPTGMYANYSRWMAYELQFAKSNQVSIVAINLRGAQRRSSTVLSYATTQCNWNKQSLVSAMESALNL